MSDVKDSAGEIVLSLISHTNAGKTTLARTLLLREVGEVDNEAHVTLVSSAYVWFECEDGTIRLWDTPGLGAEVETLSRRINPESGPVGKVVQHLLHTVYDRFRDRGLWCTQKGLQNVKEEADVVLFVIDLSDGEKNQYLETEMQILKWLGKPVIIVLNQVGEIGYKGFASDFDEISARLRQFIPESNVVSLDAFTRCWVHEVVLLEKVIEVIGEAKRTICTRTLRQFKDSRLQQLEQAGDEITEFLAESSRDRVKLAEVPVWKQLELIVNSDARKPELDAAQNKMYQLLEKRTVQMVNRLIEIHGLEGTTAQKLAKISQDRFNTTSDAPEALLALVGGAGAGIATGVVADLLAGGLTLGSGAIVGGLLGGATSYALARGYNLAQAERNTVRWKDQHLSNQLATCILLYLGVAHFGRGRGKWQDRKPSQIWERAVTEVTDRYEPALNAIWSRASKSDGKIDATELRDVVKHVLRSVIQTLYPRESERFF